MTNLQNSSIFYLNATYHHAYGQNPLDSWVGKLRVQKDGSTMAEVTAFGKILRKMRIDCSEVLGVMAKKLTVSPAYLSSIENGGREIPDGFIEKVVAVYGLSEEKKNELEEAKAKVKGVVDVKFTGQKSEANYVETAVMFAKDFSRLTAEQVNQLKELLKRFESSGEYSNGSVSV